jgi:hypothetical protein
VAGVGPVGGANPVPDPNLGHGAASFIMADETGQGYSCVYTPASLQQHFAVTTTGAWKIFALTPSRAERLLVAGGPISDVNRPYQGTFNVFPGERVILVAYGTCAGQDVPTVTVPGTGQGVEGGDVCVGAGGIYAGG